MLTDVLSAEQANGWQGLVGSTVELAIPIRQPLIDRMLTQAPLPGAIAGLDVRLADGNRLLVDVVGVLFGFKKRFELTVRLAPELDGSGGSHRLHAVLEDAALLSAALAIVGPAFKLPRGISLDPPRVSIDLDALAEGTPASDAIRMLTSMTLDGSRDTLWVRAALDMKEPLQFRSGRLPAGSHLAKRPPFSIDELVAWLNGARAVWRVRIAERLANAGLAAALQAFRSGSVGPSQPGNGSRTEPAATPGGTDARTREMLLERARTAIRSLRLVFESGAMVVEGDALLDV